MISYSTQPNSQVVELHVGGRVTNQELTDNIERLKGDLDLHGKTRIIEIIDHFTGIEPAAILTDIKLGIPLAQKVSRVAVVADQAWIRAAVNLGRVFTKAEIKAFAPIALAEARTWINETSSFH